MFIYLCVFKLEDFFELMVLKDTVHHGLEQECEVAGHIKSIEKLKARK